MPSQPSRHLEVVPNPHADREYEVALEIPEFTCLCPMTGQPDFATIRVRYVPDLHLVELKSIKLYIWSYRWRRPTRGGSKWWATSAFVAGSRRWSAPRTASARRSERAPP